MAKKNEFSYSYRDDNDSTGANKLLKRAVLLFIISAILVAISHFFLIKKKEALVSKTPILKENKEKLTKELGEINDQIKYTEDGNKKTQEIIKKYDK